MNAFGSLDDMLAASDTLTRQAEAVARTMYRLPAGPDAARTSPPHRMPIEPSFEADRRESPPLFDELDVLPGCPGQKKIIEAAGSFAGRDQTDFEVWQHPA